jgi:hypothetical protein
MVPKSTVRLYGNDTFCLVLAQKFDLELVSPADDLMASLPERFLKRKLEIVSLGFIAQHHFPVFIKPVIPKLFRAGVYHTLAELQKEVAGLANDTRLIVSEIVDFSAEARSFVLNGEVKACAIYEGSADCEQALAFVQEITKSVALPVTCVLDVGFIADRGFAFIEANAAWGAGLNGCDPNGVVPCIEAAVTNLPDQTHR